MRTYNYLSEEEVFYYRSLNEEQLDCVQILQYYTNITISNIIMNEPFHVINGDWEGVLIEVGGEYQLQINVVTMDSEYVEYTDVTYEYLNDGGNLLDIYYIKDHNRFEEFLKIYTDKTTHLFNADENCDHEIIGGYNYSGVRCGKCDGWYCA